MSNKKLAALVLFLGTAAFAGDTPFINYHCTVGAPMEAEEFDLSFHSEGTLEAVDWSSPFGRTKLHFEKVSADSVMVHLSTGLPLLAKASPQEVRFTAPLVTDQFDFSMGIDPLTISGGDMVNLLCRKRK